MSVRDAHEADGEGYFASISDLMVGILFVFLLMLTVFALNLRESEDVSKRLFDEKVAQLVAARQDAERAQADARHAQSEAEAAKSEAREIRKKLNRAVEALKTEVNNRETARDNLLKTLSASLNSQGVKVTFTPHSDVLRLPEELLFKKGLATLSGAPAQDALKKLSDALSKDLPCFTDDPTAGSNCTPDERAALEGVLIEGHSDRQAFNCDNVPTLTPDQSRECNDRLSVNRALTVFREMKLRNLDRLKNAGGFALLAVSAYGDRRPVSDGGTAEDFQKNRRIDLRFLLSSRTSDDLKRLIEEIEPEMRQP